MKPTDPLRALEAELGASALRETAHELAGTRIACEVEPQDGSALASTLRVLGESGGRALVRGRGTNDDLGNISAEVDIVVSTRALAGVEELDAQDGVVRVRAGTTLAELADAAAPHGWAVALGALSSASVGGALACASVGPRRLGEGPPRDCVLGMDVVLATGERTTCGGRVVKNVTGFDLAKLYTGSFGCLGVIEAAWLRLRPLPERVGTWHASLTGAQDPVGLAIAAARRPTARCAVLLDPPVARRLGLDVQSDTTLVVEYAGIGAGVRDDLRWLMERCDASELRGDAIEEIARLQTTAPAAGGVRARVAALPSRCGRVAQSLREAGAQLIVHPGVGLLYAEWPEARDAHAALPAVERAARSARGEARFEALPLELKRGRDVFGVGVDTRAVQERMRALKLEFDPHGVLNPGRFLGQL